MSSAAREIHVSLDASCFGLLADSISETPESVMALHCLRRRLCKVHLAGDPRNFTAAVIQGDPMPDEPEGFGDDPHLLWRLLRETKGWVCIYVHGDCAKELAKIMSRETGVPARLYGSRCFTLAKPVAICRHDDVRLMTPDDIEFLLSAPKEVRGSGFENREALLTDGIVACAVVDGEVAAIAHVGAITDRYAEIGVYTLDRYRGRGYSTAAAGMVAAEIQKTGRTPVWSTGEDNFASQRVAEKLGFTEVSRQFYVIPGEGPETLCWDGSIFRR